MRIARLGLVLLAVAALVPGGAQATTTSYTAPYQTGPRGGDAFNLASVDPAAGRLSLMRLQPPLVSGGLGCGGRAGFVTLEVRNITQPISAVSLSVDEAVWNAYTWITVSVRSTDDSGEGIFLGTTKARGPGVGTATVDLEIDPGNRVPAGRPQTVRFGLEVSSSCIANVDGGSARFPSVTVVTA